MALVAGAALAVAPTKAFVEHAAFPSSRPPTVRQRAAGVPLSGAAVATAPSPSSAGAARIALGALTASAAAFAVGVAGVLRRPRRGASIDQGGAQRPRLVRNFFGGLGGKKREEEGKEPRELSEEEKAMCAQIEEEIEALKSEAEEKQNAHERLKLEVDNYRKRTRSELAQARGDAATPIVKELLPIADEFGLARQNLKFEGDGEKAIVDRFDDLFARMLGTWTSVGVEKMASVGQDFNPEFHEAVSMIPSVEYKEEVVCNELRAGWVLKPAGAEQAKVLRAALVCVSSGPGPS